MLSNPETLSKQDLKDAYYFIIWKGKFKQTSTLAAEMTNQFRSHVQRNAIAIHKNAGLRAYNRRGEYTDANLKMIQALKLVAENLETTNPASKP